MEIDVKMITDSIQSIAVAVSTIIGAVGIILAALASLFKRGRQAIGDITEAAMGKTTNPKGIGR